MEKLQMLDGIQFAKMIHGGTAGLRTQVQTINNLNVFPIPDGDTGDNMLLTMMGGADAAGEGEKHLGNTARKAADGMILSARGNSGVILSQFFDGIASGFDGMDAADPMQVAAAFRCGVEHAYNAVMEPTEGTILTVARNAAEYADSRVSENISDLLRNFIDEAKRTLDRTPELLPVLKKAGVVDSGGAGLIYIVEGMEKSLHEEYAMLLEPFVTSAQKLDLNLFTEDSVLEYGYCTELLLRLQRCKTDPDTFQVSTITDYLKGIGDSVVTFKTGSIVKLHVHTKTPDKVLAFCQKYGEFLKIKIENMSLQHNNIEPEEPKKERKSKKRKKSFGVVAAVSGEGIRQMFIERGADVIVDGGQSMNPSTEAFLEAFKKIDADTIFVLPNNGNIVLTAKQAAGLYQAADVRVVESTTIGEGYAALSMLCADSGDADEIYDEMTSGMQSTMTAMVSKCVRDTDETHAGDYVGFVQKEILSDAPDRLDATCRLIDKMDSDDYDICLLIYGNAVQADEAEKVTDYFTSVYPDKEIYLVDGKQDIYDYTLILE